MFLGIVKSLLPIQQPSSEKMFMINYQTRLMIPLLPSFIPMSIESSMHAQEKMRLVQVMNPPTVDTHHRQAAALNRSLPLRVWLMGGETRLLLDPFPNDPPHLPMLTWMTSSMRFGCEFRKTQAATKMRWMICTHL